MTKSNTKNYYIVKEALYKHFPKEAIIDHPSNYFKDEGQCVLIFYDTPHHLEYNYQMNLSPTPKDIELKKNKWVYALYGIYG